MEKLTAAEERVMKYYWQQGPSIVSAIIEMMPDPKPAHSTISTITRSLEKKGYLTHKAYGRTYEYHPAVKQDQYLLIRVGSMVKDFFKGSPRQLVSFLVEEEEIDAKELYELLDQLENKKKDE